MLVTSAHVSVREEGARRVVRIVQQLELELVRLDAAQRERVGVLLGAARAARVDAVEQRLLLGGVLGLDALEPVERLEVGVLREQVRVGG